MITGKKSTEHISKEHLLQLTEQGKKVYEMYLGRITRQAMKRPWGEDKHPSFGVWQAPDGEWMWKDQARDESGDCVKFVQKLFNLSFGGAIDRVVNDLKLDVNLIVEQTPQTKEYRERQNYSHIACKVMKFKQRHHQFWNVVGVTESICKKFNCYAVKELAINHQKVKLGEHEIVFVYFAEDIDRVKVYFPDRGGADRFRTNVPYHYLWQYNKLPEQCDKLVIHKSMKDLLVFSQIHDCNIATQNESVSVFDDSVVEKITSKCTQPWLFYGSDKDGMTKAKEIKKKLGWSTINTPTSLLPDINDAYSYVKQYGLKKLEELCKIKNLIT